MPKRKRAAVESHIFGVLKQSILFALKSDTLPVFRVKMSSRFQILVCAVLAAAPLWLSAGASAQQDIDPELRIERLENQLRTLTGQNEELQYRNRLLEEQLRALQSAQPAQPNQATAPRPAAPNVVAAPQAQPNPGYQPPLPGAGQAPPVIAAPVASSGRRGDAFDPSQSPNAPGVPRALGEVRRRWPKVRSARRAAVMQANRSICRMSAIRAIPIVRRCSARCSRRRTRRRR